MAKRGFFNRLHRAAAQGVIWASIFAVAAAGADLAEGHAALEAKDFEKAVAVFEPLARAGDVDAQYNYATLLLYGYGTEKDEALAREFYLEAVANGSGQAANSLGVIYARAIGVEQDMVESYAWFRVASLLGNGEARTNLYKLARAMSEDEVQQGRTRADELRKEAAPRTPR